jgi:hypothetical protein
MLAKPNRRPDDENIAGDDLLAQSRPLVTVPFVRTHPGFDIQVRNADNLTLRIIFVKGIKQPFFIELRRYPRTSMPAATYFEPATFGTSMPSAVARSIW